MTATTKSQIILKYDENGRVWFTRESVLGAKVKGLYMRKYWFEGVVEKFQTNSYTGVSDMWIRTDSIPDREYVMMTVEYDGRWASKAPDTYKFSHNVFCGS